MNEKVTYNNAKKLLLDTRLKECRKEMRLSQRELADQVNQIPKENGSYALNVKYLSAMENGRRTISKQYAEAFSVVLHIDKEYLLDPEWKYPYGFDLGLQEIEKAKKLQEEVLQEIKYLNSAGLKVIRDCAAGLRTLSEYRNGTIPS